MRRSETLTEKVYRLLSCTAVQEAVPNPVTLCCLRALACARRYRGVLTIVSVPVSSTATAIAMFTCESSGLN